MPLFIWIRQIRLSEFHIRSDNDLFNWRTLAYLDFHSRDEKESIDQMPTPPFLTNALKLLKSNAPEILTALGVTGVVTTAVLATKAAFKASDHLSQFGPDLSNKEKAKETWKFYIPVGISGVATCACILCASKASNNRTAAAVSAYAVTQQAFTEYKGKVLEQLSVNKEQNIRDGIAQEKITATSGSREVIITGKGQNLCCELMTRRYFKSDMETLRKAQNDINAMVVNNFYVTLSEFYDIIELPYTSVSSKLGWDSDKLMELEFTTTLSEDGEPCLAFDYNYTKPLR